MRYGPNQVGHSLNQVGYKHEFDRGFFLHFTSVFPSIGSWTVPAYRTFCWSGEPFYIRMPFQTKTNDVYVGARTFYLSIESPTRNLYTTAGL